MSSPFVLVVVLLTVESSYLQNLERPRDLVPDTVQFWFTAEVDWRIKTFAIDHDIHVHQIRTGSTARKFSPKDAVASTRKNYGDVIETVLLLEIADPNDKGEVDRVLKAHHLEGTLEIGKSGVASYNPDHGQYRSQSNPE